MLQLHQRGANRGEVDLAKDDRVVTFGIDVDDINVSSLGHCEKVVERDRVDLNGPDAVGETGMSRPWRIRRSRSSVESWVVHGGRSGVGSTV